MVAPLWEIRSMRSGDAQVMLLNGSESTVNWPINVACSRWRVGDSRLRGKVELKILRVGVKGESRDETT